MTENCDGTNKACPADAFKPSSTVCRDASGDCDVAENCTGNSAACPNDEKKPNTTICRASAGVCDLAEKCDGVSNDCPVDAFKPSTTVCRPDTGLCDVAEYCSGSGADCPADAREQCAVVTTSSFCTFDVTDACGSPDPEFKLLFTPDAQNWVAYKLNASNPGQFYYNLFVEGTSSVKVHVPWPFVTQGAMPVHIYPPATVSTTGTCFSYPGEGQALGLTIGIGDWVNGKADPSVFCPATGGLAGPPASGSDYCTIEVPLPDTGGYYVAIHLDYGFKGPQVNANPADSDPATGAPISDRYDKAANLDALVNTVDNTGALAIPQCHPHTFCHTLLGEGDSCRAGLTDTVLNSNDFKKIAGVFGQVFNSTNGNGITPAHVRLRRISTNSIVAQGDADSDGYYMLAYKHTGKAELYRVELTSPAGVNVNVQLKANSWAEVNFAYDSNTNTWTPIVP